MGSSEPRSNDLNSQNDTHLKQSLAEDDKAWKKADIIPRRFDELPPEPDWIPVADVIRTQREETAKAEAKKMKIKPPLDTDSEPVSKKQHEKPDAAPDKEDIQEAGDKNLQTIEKHDNMKPRSLDEDLNETSDEVDAVTKSMMNWALKPDYFIKKKSAHLAGPDRRNSAPVNTLSEYSKAAPPIKPDTSDSQHHYEREEIPPEQSDHNSYRRGSTQLPSKYDRDSQYEHRHRYHEPIPDYDQEDPIHEPHPRYERDSYSGPDLFDDDYLKHNPEYDDRYYGPDQDYKYSRYHDPIPEYDTKPSRTFDLDHGGHYHDPRPHHHDHYQHPKHQYKHDNYHDTSHYYEDDHYPDHYRGSGRGQYGRHSSNSERGHYHSHDRNYELDFQQFVDTDHTKNYKHQPWSGRRSHEPSHLY